MMMMMRDVARPATFDTMRLINEVQARPPLWNTRIVSGKETVERLWSEVAHVLCTTGKDVKMKWKNLKDTFRKEMKKSMESGVTPVWPHYQRLTFLTEILLQSKRISYSSEEVLYPNVVHHEARFDSEDSNTENQMISEPEVRLSPKRRRETEEMNVKQETVEASRDAFDNMASHEYNNPETHARLPSQVNPWDCYSMDEDYHFFMSLMPHMRNFAPLQKLKIRNRIQEIIIQEMSAETRSDGATSSTEATK